MNVRDSLSGMPLFFCSEEVHVPRLPVKAHGEVNTASVLQINSYSFGCVWNFLGMLSLGRLNGGVPLVSPEMVTR